MSSSTAEATLSPGKKFCECKCGEIIDEFDNRQRPRRFKYSHRSNLPRNHKTGIEHFRWKGGEIIHNGYVMTRMPEHPFVTRMGYVKKQRLVIESELSRLLGYSVFIDPSMPVHHIDGNPLNNEISNLQLYFSHSLHVSENPPKQKTHDQKCLLCGSERVWEQGVRNNKQRFRCRDCCRSFSIQVRINTQLDNYL
jgi:hypothetical protein